MKTNTISIHEKFKGELAKKYFYFENLIGNHNYIREVGSDYNFIEKQAFETIEKVYKCDFSTLTLEVRGE